MKDKIKVGLILLLALIMSLILEYFVNYLFDILVLFFTMMALIECRKTQLKAGYPSFRYVPEISCFILFVAMITGMLCGLKAVTILLIFLGLIALIYLVCFLGSILLFKKDLEKDIFRQVSNMNVYNFAFFKTNNVLSLIIYPTLFMFFLSFINHMSSLGLNLNSKVKGMPLDLFGLILLFAICCMSDACAMIFGTLIGGKKLLSKVSPKKTISGACFGLLGGAIGSLLTYFAFSRIVPSSFVGIYFWQFLIIGIIGSIVSQAGDIFESLLKRRANIKDTGDFFRSHGGVLDRFDSILITAPFIFSCIIFLFR